MRRLPLTLKEQLLLAHERGHDLAVEDVPGRPGDRIVCTCGYRSTPRQTRRELNGTMAWHLGKIIADWLDTKDGQAPVVPLRGGPGDSAGATTVSGLELRAK